MEAGGGGVGDRRRIAARESERAGVVRDDAERSMGRRRHDREGELAVVQVGAAQRDVDGRVLIGRRRHGGGARRCRIGERRRGRRGGTSPERGGRQQGERRGRQNRQRRGGRQWQVDDLNDRRLERCDDVVPVRLTDVGGLRCRHHELPLLRVDLGDVLRCGQVVRVVTEEVVDAVRAVRALRLAELAVDVARAGVGGRPAHVAAVRLAVGRAVAVHHARVVRRLAGPRARHRVVARAVVEARVVAVVRHDGGVLRRRRTLDLDDVDE